MKKLLLALFLVAVLIPILSAQELKFYPIYGEAREVLYPGQQHANHTRNVTAVFEGFSIFGDPVMLTQSAEVLMNSSSAKPYQIFVTSFHNLTHVTLTFGNATPQVYNLTPNVPVYADELVHIYQVPGKEK